MNAQRFDERYLGGESTELDFFATMEGHEIWLNTNGKEGSRAVFMHVNFAGADFSDIPVSYAVFKNCNLRGAKFSGKIVGVDFTSSSLQKAVFQCEGIEGCNFAGANLSGVVMDSLRFNGCVFANSVFVNSSLISAEFIDSKIDNAEVLGCDFEGVRFQGCEIFASSMLASSFSDVRFANTKITSCDFGGSNFAGAEFDSCGVYSSKFQVFEHKDYEPMMAELRGAVFMNCEVLQCLFPKGFVFKNVKSKNRVKKPRRLSFFATNKSINIVTNIFVLTSIAIIASGVVGFALGQMNYISRFFYAVSIFLTCNTYTALIVILQKRLLNALDATNLASSVKIESRVIKMLYGFVVRKQYVAQIYAIFFLPSAFLCGAWVVCLMEDNLVLALANFAMCFYSFASSLLMFRTIKGDLERFIRN